MPWLPPAHFPASREKTPLSLQSASPNVENLKDIRGLGTIWPSFPAAEFGALGRELAAEFETRPLAYLWQATRARGEIELARQVTRRQAEEYRHDEEALLRPDVGTQAQFKKLGRFAEPAMKLATRGFSAGTSQAAWGLVQALRRRRTVMVPGEGRA